MKKEIVDEVVEPIWGEDFAKWKFSYGYLAKVPQLPLVNIRGRKYKTYVFSKVTENGNYEIDGGPEGGIIQISPDKNDRRYEALLIETPSTPRRTSYICKDGSSVIKVDTTADMDYSYLFVEKKDKYDVYIAVGFKSGGDILYVRHDSLPKSFIEMIKNTITIEDLGKNKTKFTIPGFSIVNQLKFNRNVTTTKDGRKKLCLNNLK